jgi:putative ABC transport system substrate-binding protein
MILERRRFIALLGASVATVCHGSAFAQTPAMPVIGVLSSASPGGFQQLLAAFRQGLGESGYVAGRNVTIEYRWASGSYDRLPGLATELVNRGATLIAATGGIISARAALAATQSIPVLFVSGSDPVKIGLVDSLSRPGGNATGVSVYTTELIGKRFELLRELVPSASTIAIMVNPDSATSETEIKDFEAAARAIDLQLIILKAASPSTIEAAFANAVRQRVQALLISADPFFTSRRAQIVALAARHTIPVAYPWRAYIEGGGLMSYGPSLTWAYHQNGLYAGRILSGAKPGDLPVQLPTKFDMVINLKAAKALGLTVSRTLLAGADELIE